MKLRILRKTVKQYDRANDAEYFVHQDQLQYSPKALEEEWYNVPIVEDLPSNNLGEKK